MKISDCGLNIVLFRASNDIHSQIDWSCLYLFGQLIKTYSEYCLFLLLKDVFLDYI